MADKGGKGFSALAGKSTPKKKGLLKGKESASSKTEDHLIHDLDSDSEGFLDDDSPSTVKVNGKTSLNASGRKTVTFEGMNFMSTGKSKGGKDFSSGKGGGKGSLPQAKPVKNLVKEVDLKLHIELPENARVLMDCEAANILKAIEEHLALLSQPDIRMPTSFSKALEYSEINNHYDDVQSTREVLDALKRNGVTDGEICMIGNIAPDTIEEVYALIPSLKANRNKTEGPIGDVLTKLAKLKKNA